MRVRPTAVGLQHLAMLRGQMDAKGARGKPKARVLAVREGTDDLQRGGPAGGEAQVGRCEHCRWATQHEALAVRVMRCELTGGGHLPSHTCSDYEREPGAEG